MTHHKNKNRHHTPTHEAAGTHKKVQASATIRICLIFTFLGIIAAALASQLNVGWMAIGAAAGALGGFLIGQGIDRATMRK